MKTIFAALGYAIQGICYLVRYESSFRKELLLIFPLIFIFFIRSIDVWSMLLVILFFLILSLEAINTAIEKLCDKVLKEKDSDIKIIKDCSAAAVFLSILSFVVVYAYALSLHFHIINFLQ